MVFGLVDAFYNQGDNLPFSVDLIAPGNSLISENDHVRLTPSIKSALGFSQPFQASRTILADVAAVRNRLIQEENTAAHFHIEDYHILGLGSDPRIRSRVVTTLHNLPKEWHYDFKEMPMIAISQAQKERVGNGFDLVEVIYNGIDETLFKPNFNVARDAGLGFLGRFSPDKNPIDAVKIALMSNSSLEIAGITDPDQEGYHLLLQEEVNKNLKNLKIIGEVSDLSLGGNLSSKNEFLRNKKALLFPIQWKEPFGLVIAEANACGTPVIAYDYPGSSVGELIVDGVNGFKVKSVEEAVEAVNKIEDIDRRGVHQHYKDNFTSKIMAEKYCAFFAKTLPSYLKS